MLHPRKRPSQLICEMNVAGFAAVMWVLVHLFILDVQMPHTRAISVDLAEAEHPRSMPEADREDAICVAVMRDGSVVLNNDKIPVDQIPARLKAELKRSDVPTVFIKADARSRYGATIEVLDAIQSTGTRNIALIVEKRSTTRFEGRSATNLSLE